MKEMRKIILPAAFAAVVLMAGSCTGCQERKAEFVPIVAASVISTVLVLAVTGWVHQCYGKAKDKIKGETKE